MRTWKLFGVLLCGAVAGCGGEPEEVSGLAAQILLDPRLPPSDIKSVDLYLAAGQSREGEALSCSKLARTPLGGRTDLVIRLHRVLRLEASHLDGITPESQLVLAADTYPMPNATGPRNGFGCQTGITVRAAQATAVTLTIAPPP
ncbi:MAG TPA: hypothetical protein VKN99_24020 [Polyangia bacterium]|nr:hypothetical protein [Polyangia bacterium]